MENDPIIARREQEAREAKTKKLRNLMIGLAVVAVALVGVVVYQNIHYRPIVKDLELEKADLTAQMIELQQEYDGLTTTNASLNAQLDTSRAEVAALIERIQKTEATNRAQMRKYEKELGTLRTIMRHYVTQIDSLNTLNHKLTAEAAAARKDASEARKANEQLAQQVDELSGQVAAGSVIKARGLHTEAYGKNDKKTDRSSRTVRLLTTLRGPVRVYIRVKDPEGILLTNSASVSFPLGDDEIVASASREVDYEGKEVELSIYLNDIPKYTKGVYTIQAYTAQTLLGETTLMLR